MNPPAVTRIRSNSTSARDCVRAARAAHRLGLSFTACEDSKAPPGHILIFEDDRVAIQIREGTRATPYAVDFIELVERPHRLPTRRDPLARAIGATPRNILDATAGFGFDAFRLASLGHTVIACERHPIVFALFEDGLRRALEHGSRAAEIAGNIDLHFALVQSMIDDLPMPDVIYLDPMFPLSRNPSALPQRRAQVLRALVGAGDSSACNRMLELALQHARDRVIIKRADDGPPLARAADWSIESKAVRYDVYRPDHR